MSLSSAERPGEKDKAACARVAARGPCLHDFNHTVCLAEWRRINLICLAACNTSQKPLSRRSAGHRDRTAVTCRRALAPFRHCRGYNYIYPALNKLINGLDSDRRVNWQQQYYCNSCYHLECD